MWHVTQYFKGTFVCTPLIVIMATGSALSIAFIFGMERGACRVNIPGSTVVALNKVYRVKAPFNPATMLVDQCNREAVAIIEKERTEGNEWINRHEDQNMPQDRLHLRTTTFTFSYLRSI
jgi:hypothetical protein